MIGHSDVPTERDLVALADGSLPASRRVQVERAVAESPRLKAIVAAQRRALSAIEHAADEQAPPALRARLELQRGPSRRTRAGSKRSLPGGARPARASWIGRAIPVGVLAGAVIAVALVLSLSTGVTAPTVADAAVLANRPSMAPAPSQRSSAPVLAGVWGAGLPFPYWRDHFGFRAVGMRWDHLNGRSTTTVFYRRGNTILAYTIVGGAPLASGARTVSTVRNGTRVGSLTAHGMRVVTWLRHNHSCVLVGHGVSERTLVSLASWRGDGGIPY